MRVYATQTQQVLWYPLPGHGDDKPAFIFTVGGEQADRPRPQSFPLLEYSPPSPSKYGRPENHLYLGRSQDLEEDVDW